MRAFALYEDIEPEDVGSDPDPSLGVWILPPVERLTITTASPPLTLWIDGVPVPAVTAPTTWISVDTTTTVYAPPQSTTVLAIHSPTVAQVASSGMLSLSDGTGWNADD